MNNTNQKNNKNTFSLKNDYIFKKIFAKEENNSKLKDFLEAILNIEIKKVVVKNPEIPKNMLDEKLVILDIRAEINEDTIIDIEMHFIELPKFVQKNSGTKSKLEQWLWVMVGKEDKMEKAGKENKEVEKTIDELNTMNLSEEERIMYEEREKAIINYNFGMASAERHGIEKGRKEGIEQKKIEIIENMIKLKIDDEIIKKSVNITDEELEKYKKKIQV